MKRLGAATALVVLLVAQGALCQVQRDEEHPEDRLLRTFYGPLEDPRAGGLYEPAAALLNAARRLPKAVELVRPSAAEEAPEPLPQTQKAEPVEIPEPAQEQWGQVVDIPVVGEEDLARVCYFAGQWREAAAIYGRLVKEDPADLHLVTMLMLSERNAGNVQDAMTLAARLGAESEGHAWSDWMFEMMDLAQDEGEAAQ